MAQPNYPTKSSTPATSSSEMTDTSETSGNMYVIFLHGKDLIKFEGFQKKIENILQTSLKAKFKKYSHTQLHSTISTLDSKIQSLIQKNNSYFKKAIFEEVRLGLHKYFS